MVPIRINPKRLLLTGEIQCAGSDLASGGLLDESEFQKALQSMLVAADKLKADLKAQERQLQKQKGSTGAARGQKKSGSSRKTASTFCVPSRFH